MHCQWGRQPAASSGGAVNMAAAAAAVLTGDATADSSDGSSGQQVMLQGLAELPPSVQQLHQRMVARLRGQQGSSSSLGAVGTISGQPAAQGASQGSVGQQQHHQHSSSQSQPHTELPGLVCEPGDSSSQAPAEFPAPGSSHVQEQHCRPSGPGSTPGSGGPAASGRHTALWLALSWSVRPASSTNHGPPGVRAADVHSIVHMAKQRAAARHSLSADQVSGSVLPAQPHASPTASSGSAGMLARSAQQQQVQPAVGVEPPRGHCSGTAPQQHGAPQHQPSAQQLHAAAQQQTTEWQASGSAGGGAFDAGTDVTVSAAFRDGERECGCCRNTAASVSWMRPSRRGWHSCRIKQLQQAVQGLGLGLGQGQGQGQGRAWQAAAAADAACSLQGTQPTSRHLVSSVFRSGPCRSWRNQREHMRAGSSRCSSSSCSPSKTRPGRPHSNTGWPQLMALSPCCWAFMRR